MFSLWGQCVGHVDLQCELMRFARPSAVSVSWPGREILPLWLVIPLITGTVLYHRVPDELLQDGTSVK